MRVTLPVLAFLIACHTSPPTVSQGSGSGETAGSRTVPMGSSAAPPAQQNDAHSVGSSATSAPTPGVTAPSSPGEPPSTGAAPSTNKPPADGPAPGAKRH